MFLRTLLSGVIALPIALAMMLPASAQAVDPRVAQLEEQVRQLTGTIEELNFQILQMQDQHSLENTLRWFESGVDDVIRKPVHIREILARIAAISRRMQEDNELRFQEIEGKRSDAGGAADAAPRDHAAAVPAAPAADSGSGDDGFYGDVPRVQDNAQILGAPPRNFGTITFDERGNATGAGLPEPTADETTVAALPPTGDADELYRNSYEFILSGDYATAEAGFRDLIARYPNGEHAADAHFWLGEALLAQEKPREAAEVFLSASRDFPQARKAPDTLFKLGTSMAAMGQRDVACATFSEVLQRFPQTTDALRERIRQEQALASC